MGIKIWHFNSSLA